MIFSRISLKNWRNFRNVDVRLAERALLVGPNASGKSNFLDALRFLRDIATDGGGLQKAVSVRGGLSKIRCLAARREPDVEIAVDVAEGGLAQWKYEIGIKQDPRGYRQPFLTHERVWRGEQLVLRRPDEADRSDRLRLTQTHLEQVNSNKDFRGLAKFFESVRYLHLVPQLVRNPEGYQGQGTPNDPYGRNFLEVIARTPQKTRASRLRRIEAALRKAVPQLKNLADIKDESGVPHLEAVYEHWRAQGARQREDQFSDGTLRLIGLFWALLDGEAPLLLEEPELSLHAEIVKILPTLFSQVQRRTRRQMLISTHSWDLLSDQGIGANEAVLLHPDREGTVAILAADDPGILESLESGLTVADVVLPRTRPGDLDKLVLAN